MTVLHSNKLLRPATKIDQPYDLVTTGPLWPFDDIDKPFAKLADEWSETFCTDDEMVELTKIPLASLLALQTAEVVYATKAPVSHGTHKRVWLLQEAAVGSMVFCLKSVARIDFKKIAKIASHASAITRVAFADYVKMRTTGQGRHFGANIVLSENRNISLQISEGLKEFDSLMSSLSVGPLNIIPFAEVHHDRATSVDYKDAEHVRRFVASFHNAKYSGTVMLGNVFTQFEQQARTLRAP
jgi:hypothetical protein